MTKVANELSSWSLFRVGQMLSVIDINSNHKDDIIIVREERHIDTSQNNKENDVLLMTV